MSAGAAYPAEQAVSIALRDGSTAHVRPVMEGDRAAIQSFLESMSAESLYFRAFGTPNVERLSNWSVDVDYADRYGLVVDEGRRRGDRRARGLRADRAAREPRSPSRSPTRCTATGSRRSCSRTSPASRSRQGITHVHRRGDAAQPPDDRGVPRTAAFPSTQQTVEGVTTIELPTSLSEETLQAFDARAQTAAIEALRELPGAERDRRDRRLAPTGTVGAEILSQPRHAVATPVASIRSTRTPRRSTACRPIRRSPRFPSRSSSRWSSVPAADRRRRGPRMRRRGRRARCS